MLMLEGLVIVDATRYLSGPFCTMILGDLGADVIKIEAPAGGDEARKFPPYINGESAYFMSINRNKKSITLNLKHKEGKNVFKKIVKNADVFVHNNRPGAMERLGLDYRALSVLNQGLIYASISGFGQNGPYKEKGAFDMIVQALGGIMSITGTPDGEPIRVGYSITDLTAGLYAAIGILGALYKRMDTGKGENLDIAMLDCQVSLMENAVARYMATGEIPKPLGNRHPSIAPFQAFKAKNGFFVLATANDKQFELLCKAIDKDLYMDEKYSSNYKRVENIDQLNSVLNEVFVKKVKEYWIKVFEEAGVPCGLINNTKELVEDVQVAARNMIVDFDHPLSGKVTVAGCPIKILESEASEFKPSPTLGQHTEDTLRWVGFSSAEITRLRNNGAC